MIRDQILEHYDKISEDQRLDKKEGLLEFYRTMDILHRMLPEAPSAVADIGGGTGRYSFELASLGHKVSLVEPVEKHIEIAKLHNSHSSHKLQSISLGEAENIPLHSTSYDTVLALGPFYHLLEQESRASAFREIHRILKPSGKAICAGISRYSSYIDMVYRGLLANDEYCSIVERTLTSGEHNPGTTKYFTQAFFHKADDLRAEMQDAGFRNIKLLAIEGPIWKVPASACGWQDEKTRAKILRFLRIIEEEPSIIGASAHFLAIGEK